MEILVLCREAFLFVWVEGASGFQAEGLFVSHTPTDLSQMLIMLGHACLILWQQATLIRIQASD